MRAFISLIWRHCSKRDKLVLIFLLLLMAIAANLELLGIGLILPIVAMLTDPKLMYQNKYLNWCITFFQPSSEKNFLLVLCILLIGIFLFKNLYLFLLTWLQSEIIRRKACQLTEKVFQLYIHAPYILFLTRSIAELKTNLSLAEGCFRGAIQAIFMVLIELINIAIIFAMLFFFVPGATFLLLLASAVLSSLIYFPLRQKNIFLGKEMYSLLQKQEHVRQQSFYGIKELRIRQAEDVFAKQNSEILNRTGKVMIRINLVAQTPRFLLEAGMVTGGILLLILYIVSGTANTSIILKFSLIGFGVVRLMPALSRIQYHISSLRQFQAPLFAVYQDLDTMQMEQVAVSSEPLTLKKEIEIRNLSFAYPNMKTKVLDRFSLTIPAKTSVAFVGKTGCGKTTLVDLIAGLLEPCEGEICTDGRNIRENLLSWRSMIGYVSQSIYIMDDSIFANVTLGCKPEEVNEQRVIDCLKIAQIYDFVLTLPEGLSTVIGENGSRLSGGQKQRIGIARALYHNPQLLILDEATSALDNETEQAFIDAITNLHGKMTILIIAHRLTTTKNCSQIIRIGEMEC